MTDIEKIADEMGESNIPLKLDDTASNTEVGDIKDGLSKVVIS